MTKKSQSWLFYFSLLIVFVFLSYWLIKSGSSFESEVQSSATPLRLMAEDANENEWTLFVQSVLHNIGEPFAILLLQLIAILITVRIFGLFCVKIGQPTVIGEILAGIVLGPSLLGFFFPEVFKFLFPAESMGNLEILSQLGLILFMFIIGMELEIDEVMKRLNETVVISHASIIVPFFFGIILSYFVYQDYAADHISFLSFSLFIGISMSITAFPVLARIVQEAGLTKTHLGTIALASAASNDVTAWCLLAVVIAIAKTGTIVSALYTIGLSIAYILFMFLVIKPFLKRIATIYQNKEVMNKGIIAFIFLILILSSYATQIIGIHALFGAFLAGVIMPGNLNFRKILTEKIEDIALVLLLPLFFVFTGLRTEIGLLNSPELWALCLVFILIGVAGKFLGTAIPARIAGESWRDSFALGSLMNARGLMELIVLNIGYEMGILPPTIFVILVLMALVTTFMTTPSLAIINKIFPAKTKDWHEDYQSVQKKFKILLSFGRPESGRKLLNIIKVLFGNQDPDIAITALHMTVGTDVNPIHADYFSEEGFEPILDEAKKIELPIKTAYRVTDDVGREIVEIVNEEDYDFLLVGAGISSAKENLFKERASTEENWVQRLYSRINKHGMLFYPGNLLKDKTKVFIEQTSTTVGVFVDRDFSEIHSLLIFLYQPEDIQLFSIAESILLNNPKVHCAILDVTGLLTKSAVTISNVRQFTDKFEENTVLLHKKPLTTELLSRYDFMLITYNSWNIVSEQYKESIQNIPSTLILNEKKQVVDKE